MSPYHALGEGGKAGVLRVRTEHTAFLQASIHCRLTSKKWREWFLQLFVSALCQMS